MKVKCNGDPDLADFILGWKKIYRGITKEVDKEAAEKLFYEQLKNCKSLEKMSTNTSAPTRETQPAHAFG